MKAAGAQGAPAAFFIQDVTLLCRSITVDRIIGVTPVPARMRIKMDGFSSYLPAESDSTAKR
jgi:hypothetical protein